jgi:hypothetical protein
MWIIMKYQVITDKTGNVVAYVPMHDMKTDQGTFGVRIEPTNPEHKLHEIDVSEEISESYQQQMIEKFKKLTQSQSQY